MQGDSIDVLYRHGPTLVVFKPSGLLTQAPPTIDSVENRLRRLLASELARPANDVYLGVPHRLDRPVSGPLLFALAKPAARKLSRQFERRQVHKLYWAAVAGQVTPSEGSWLDWMRKVPGEPRGELVEATHPEAQQAVLHYRVLHRAESWSCLELRLETGRTHQIRVQASARGHAVLGDTLYGSTIPFGPPATDLREQQIALHGRELGFTDPTTKQAVLIRAPLPAAWDALELSAELHDRGPPPAPFTAPNAGTA